MARAFWLSAPFVRLWAATGAANLGDGITRFGLPLLALAVGAPPSGVAAVTAALTFAWPAFGLFAGWIVDRAPRGALLVAANATRALVAGALVIVLVTDSLTLPLILAAAVLLGVAETLVDTALTATVPLVVETSGYGRANARLEATINATNELAGPPLAGLLAGVALALTAVSGAGLYAVAALLLIGLLPRRSTGTAGRGEQPIEKAMSGLWSGILLLAREPLLRSLTLFTAAMNLVWSAALSLLVIYAVAPGPLGLSPAGYGTLLTAMAVGGLAASVITEPLRRRFGDARLLIADCIGTVLLVLPVAIGGGVVFVAVGAVIAGAGSSIWRIINATIRQNLTPPELLGRVYAASRVISWGVVPVGSLAAGFTADVWGVQFVFAAATVLAIGVAVAFLPFANQAARKAAPARPLA